MGQGLSVYGNLRNALNRRYEEVLGFPSPKAELRGRNALDAEEGTVASAAWSRSANRGGCALSIRNLERNTEAAFPVP